MSLPANDRQRAVPLDGQNYTPIKGLIYCTVFIALSFSILAFSLAPQLKVDYQNFNSLTGNSQPVSQAIIKQATPATELADTSESVKEIESTGEQVSVQEPVDGSANVPAQFPEASVSALELATIESSEELAPEVGFQIFFESKNHAEEVIEVTERPAQQSEPMIPLGTELAAIEDFDADNRSLPKSISDIELTVYVEETPVQQSGLAVLEPQSLETELVQVAETLTNDQILDEQVVPVELVVQVEAEHVQQIERIQPELAVVIDSDMHAQQAGESASSRRFLEYTDADSDQGSRSVQSTKTELVQVAAVGVIQQSHIEPVSNTELIARIDEESDEQPKTVLPDFEPRATELTAVTDFDEENQNLPESFSDIESIVYVEETPVQQAELATLEPESLETELKHVAESVTDDQSLDELAAPTELVIQFVAEREEPEFIEIELDHSYRELQPVTTQMVQVAAVGIIQQSHIEPVSDTESIARIGEESVDQSQPPVPVLKSIVAELAALKDFGAEYQSLPEIVSDFELTAYAGEFSGPEQPALLETEAKQVAESLIGDQKFDEQFLPAELAIKVESESGRSSRELQPATTKSDQSTEADVVQQIHIEPIRDTELAEAAESEANDEGLGGPITDYEQALQLDQQPNQQSQPEVTVLEPVSGEEKLVPTGVTEPVILLSTDLESLANAPVVLTESNVRPGDTLSAIFKRNNLSYKIAQRLISAPGSKPISVLYPRDHLKFVWSNNKLLGIELRRKNKLSLMATYDGSQFSVINIREARRAGTIVKLLKQEIESVEREDLIDYETQYAKLKSTNLKWSTTTVKKGDALSKIFRRTGLSAVEAIAVAGYPGNEWLATGLRPGQVMNIAKSEEGKFAILEVPEKGTAKVRLVFPVEGGFFVGFKKIKAEVQEHYACAKVESSLYSAGYAINIPREVLDEFVSLFESRFDFSRQLQRGDQFCIIYDREYIKGKPLKEVNIKAGSLIQEEAELHAFRHVDDDDKVAYYDDEGLNMQGHFLRSPIKSARVVSKFSKRRYHPVLKTNRPHLGVDYGARTGTPIRSTATGQVIKRGWSGGYGQMIIIQHGSKYRTLYAHMSRYADGTSVGSYVKQGQVIGYVGSTGLSTGPHLHYEFHVNGRHRDPLQYDMPKGQPIPEQYKIAFQTVVNKFSKRLASIDAPQVEYRPSTHQTASSQ